MIGKCPNCGRPYKVVKEAIGRHARCDDCRQVFMVAPSPQPSDIPPPPIDPTPDDPTSPVYRRNSPGGGVELLTLSDVDAVARKHRKLLIGAGVVMLMVTFVAGLALGLNIHPPDQHERERGQNEGYALGYAAGLDDGNTAGIAAGLARGKLIGYDEGQHAAAVATHRLEKVIEGKKQTLADVRLAHARKLEEEHQARQRAKREAESIGLQKGREELAAARAAWRDECSRQIGIARRDAYNEGIHEAGYDDWYAKGRAYGIEKANADCDIRVKGVEARVRDDGFRAGREAGYSAGHADGIKEGKAEGRRLGYAEGHEIGDRQGYNRGYQDCRDSMAGP